MFRDFRSFAGMLLLISSVGASANAVTPAADRSPVYRVTAYRINTATPQAANLLYLECSIAPTEFNGNPVSLDVRVDLAASTVNGVNALIYDDRIIWANNAGAQFNLNRYSGHVDVYGKQSEIQHLRGTGQCTVLKDRKF